MSFFLKYAITFAILLMGCHWCYSQETKADSLRDVADSIKEVKAARKRGFFGNIVYGIKTSFGKDTTGRRESVTVLNTESLLPYEGKAIRSITTRQLGFEVSITDTSNDFLYFGTQVLNKMHVKSKEYTIRRNLYIKEGMNMNAYLIADNERFLRTIGFIQDSRIIVNRRTSTKDSVDLIVITKDLFSFVPIVGGLSPQRQRLGISDNNIMGTGQNASISVLHDTRRSPSVGIQTTYGYNNMMGTFINTSVGFSRIAKNIYDHREDEENYMLSFDRPLVSQYKRIAGGLLIGSARSLNIYPNYYGGDYYRYQYGLIDAWVGYNIGAKKYLSDQKMHVKKFVAMRVFGTHFFQTPYQVNESVYDQRFNSNQGVLVGLTLFRQFYYKTKYIYGFGVTEDVPTGFNVSINAGWYKQLDLSRPYLGVDAYRYFVTPRRGIGCLFLRVGGFMDQGQFQDVAFLAGASFYSRLVPVGTSKMRQYLRISYADILNRIALDPLRINNTLGLRSFTSDLASGDSRLALRAESEFYLQQKLFGFKLAPFITGDLIYLSNNKSLVDQSGIFYGVGGGIRTRNENLVFGTIELRGLVYPRAVVGDNRVKISMAINLRFRYNNTYVNKPNIIELNGDTYGDIY